MEPTKVIRIKEVVSVTGLSRSSIYAFATAGTFPKPISLGAKAVGWLHSEIQEWVLSRPKS